MLGKKEYFEPAKSVRNFLPKYKGLYGPYDAFQNLIVLEYIHAREAFLEYSMFKEEDKLNELIAILYRPKKSFHWIRKLFSNYNGQLRIDYNENNLESRIKKVAKWPNHIKYAIYLYFLGCDDYLKSGEVTIGGNQIDLSILYKNADDDSSSSGDGLGFLGILYKIADTGTFGNINEASRINLYDFILKLYQNRMEYIEFKSKQKKNDNNK
jgi:hypothetical protein